MATALRKSFRLIMILAWLLSGPACVINLMDQPYERSASGNAFHRILAMEPGGTIQLENEEGDIEVRGWERDEVEITAEAEFLPPFRPGFSVSSWGPPRPRIQVTSSEDFVKIKSPSLEENRVVGAIHYILNVPKSVALKDIRNENGDITITDVFGEIAVDLGEGDLIIENFSGSVEVSVDLGTVEADLLDLREEDEIRIVSRRGDITIFLQPDADVRLEASAPEGSVDSEFELGQELPAKKVSGAIRAGKTPILLTALSGDIAVKKAD